MLVIHGTRDATVDVEESRNLAAALAEADQEFVYAEMDADHFDVAEQPPLPPMAPFCGPRMRRLSRSSHLGFIIGVHPALDTETSGLSP